jgi:hypothetical protein
MAPAGPSRPDGRGNGGHRRWWNLVLLAPLLLLFPPLYDFDQPRLFGMPGFYWMQFVFVVVGVVSVGVAYLLARDEPVRTDRPDRLSVDDLDRGATDEESDR